MTTTPNEAAQPQQKQYASTGRLGAVMFIGQLGWAAVGAACGTLLAALAAEVKPEDKVDFLALLTTTGAIAAVICMITAGTLSDRTRSRFGPRNPWIIGGAIIGTLAFAAIGLTRNPALLVIAHMIYQGGLNCMLGAFNAVPPDYVPRIPRRSLDDADLEHHRGLPPATSPAAQSLPTAAGHLASVRIPDEAARGWTVLVDSGWPVPFRHLPVHGDAVPALHRH